MKVWELKEALALVDPDAEVVRTSGIGWPTFNPLQHTATLRIRSMGISFPYWFEKVDDLDDNNDTYKAVVIY